MSEIITVLVVALLVYLVYRFFVWFYPRYQVFHWMLKDLREEFNDKN